jgi:MFS family permease
MAIQNRWGIAAAGVVMQIALGAVYAWSVFRIPLTTAFGWTISEVTLTFTIAIFVLGLAAFGGGLWMRRAGPRTVALTAGVLYGLGVFLASFAGGRLWWLYCSYGVIAGVGLGLGYIVPVATLVKWFPDKRGLITGLAVAGFGAGALITAPIATRLVAEVGVQRTFAILGAAYFVAVTGGALFMRNPPAGYQPPSRSWRFGEPRRSSPASTASEGGPPSRSWRFGEPRRSSPASTASEGGPPSRSWRFGEPRRSSPASTAGEGGPPSRSWRFGEPRRSSPASTASEGGPPSRSWRSGEPRRSSPASTASEGGPPSPRHGPRSSSAGNELTAVRREMQAGVPRSLKDALRTWQWYGLWTLLFLNTTAGIAVISQAAPMFQEITRISPSRAASIVGLISIANGAGRLLWAWLSDLVGRRVVFLAMFLLQAIIFWLMPSAHSLSLFAALTIAVLLCYGGGFGTMPAFAADYFGAEHVGSIYGLMLTAWGMAGVLGPTLMAALRQRSGGYDRGLRLIAGLMLVSAIIPLLVRPPRSTEVSAV